MLLKEQENLLKRAALYKNNLRFPLNMQELGGKEKSTEPFGILNPFCIKSHTENCSKIDDTVQNSTLNANTPADEDVDEEYDDIRSMKSPLEEILSKRGGNYFKENFRYNPMNSCTETTSLTSHKERSSSSSTSSTPSPMLKPVPESTLLQDYSSIEEETKCVVCNAIFPSVWLLEQHAALQHANLGPMEEKPFICEQCGQSYRYRSAYVKHREQNHRARLPADKLFTCDVCGMQFRYLKSFKKHRLNHALERLHGKCEKRAQQLGVAAAASTTSGGRTENSNELVTSSNEALSDEINELQYVIKAEEEEEDQDNTIDSPTGGIVTESPKPNLINSSLGASGGNGGIISTVNNINSCIGSIVSTRTTHSDAIANTSPLTQDEANFILKVQILLNNDYFLYKVSTFNLNLQSYEMQC